MLLEILNLIFTPLGSGNTSSSFGQKIKTWQDEEEYLSKRLWALLGILFYTFFFLTLLLVLCFVIYMQFFKQP